MGTARKLPMAKKKRRSALQKKQIMSQQLKGWAVNSANARLAREGERKGIKYDVSRNVLVRRAVDAYKRRKGLYGNRASKKALGEDSTGHQGSSLASLLSRAGGVVSSLFASRQQAAAPTAKAARAAPAPGTAGKRDPQHMQHMREVKQSIKSRRKEIAKGAVSARWEAAQARAAARADAAGDDDASEEDEEPVVSSRTRRHEAGAPPAFYPEDDRVGAVLAAVLLRRCEAAGPEWCTEERWRREGWLPERKTSQRQEHQGGKIVFINRDLLPACHERLRNARPSLSPLPPPPPPPLSSTSSKKDLPSSSPGRPRLIRSNAACGGSCL